MARRAFNDMDAELLLRLANRTDVTPAMRATFIKDGYLAVAIRYRHAEIEKIASGETIAQGSDTLTPITTDIWWPRMLRNNTDGYIIRRESLERVERLQQKPSAPPYTFYWWGKVFHFESLANTSKAVKVWYKRKPVDFTGTQNSELDEVFDPCIVMEAARIALETLREFSEAMEQFKLLTAYEERTRLPVDEEALNDYRQGFKVRFK